MFRGRGANPRKQSFPVVEDDDLRPWRCGQRRKDGREANPLGQRVFKDALIYSSGCI
ncbi:MAG: hypothetical protein AAFY50_14955 [Cyanobacteria bacterium J06648_1]